MESENLTFEADQQAAAASTGNPLLVVLKVRNLRLLWAGQSVSMLGTQFYMIALPWLVLKLTDDPFAVGLVLALAGIPRAMFILVGGALTDRFSPRTLMILSNLTRALIVGVLTALVLTGLINIWMLYVLGFTFGLADAFYFPAQVSLMPRIIKSEHLISANSIVQGTGQLAIALGPALAGALIALFSHTPAVGASAASQAELSGLGAAFGINTLTYLFSVSMLFLLKMEPRSIDDETSDGKNVLSSIIEGIVYVFTHKTLRWLFLVTAISHFMIEGPIFVGIPVLANTRFPEGAAAFGIILSGLGAGMLVGIVLAGSMPKLPAKWMGMILLLLISSSGLGMITIGLVMYTYVVATVAFFMGLAQGYVIIQYTTWIQRSTPEDMMGRVFSLMIFGSIGLIPISNFLSGFLIRFSTPGLFIGAGLCITIPVGLIALKPEIRSMGLNMVNGDP